MARIVLFAAVLILAPLLALAETGPQPGQRFAVDPSRLPEPEATPSADNPPEIVPRPKDMVLAVPAGFRASLVADNLRDPRHLLAIPGGGLLVAESDSGRLLLLGKGVPTVFATGFHIPYGLALRGDRVWVADVEGVWTLPWRGGRPARTSDRQRMTSPGAFGDAAGHTTRSLAIAPSGEDFFVGIGSVANIAVEPAPKATIQEFAIDGGNQRTFSSGLRNPTDLAFRPGTEELWTVVNERDGMGDGLVPDYLTRVVQGSFYGWPYAYIGPHPQPGFAAKAPEKVASTRVPDLLFNAHSAPLGLAFWHGDAYVALHGSWNSATPQGFFVARVPFDKGHPVGWYEAFATGFIVGEHNGHARVWGRPVAVTVGADDALYVCDDAGGTVWRIARERR